MFLVIGNVVGNYSCYYVMVCLW